MTKQRRMVFTPEIKEKWVQDDPLLEYVMYDIEVTINFRFEQSLKTCSLVIIFALPQSWEPCVSHINKSNGLTRGKALTTLNPAFPIMHHHS